MTTSLIENIRNDTLMTQSLDGSNVAANSAKKTNNSYSQDSTARIANANQHNGKMEFGVILFLLSE